MEIVGRTVPELGTMIVRNRLVSLLETERPSLTVFCAAAGYGKTVLATQVAHLSDADCVIWVDLSDVDVHGEYVLLQTISALTPASVACANALSRVPQPQDLTGANQYMVLSEKLRRLNGQRVLLVLDGANELRDVGAVEAVAQTLREQTSSGSRTLVTCRRIVASEPVSPSSTWVIEGPDLRFTLEELDSLIARVRSYGDTGTDAGDLLSRYQGHPAITRIMLRYGAGHCDQRHAKNLLWQIQRILSRLSEVEIASLYLAVVLREGRVQDLERCAIVSDLRMDWSRLGEAIPLFTISDTPRGLAFRTHAALAESARETAEAMIEADDLAAIRQTAFEQLDHEGEYAILARALEVFASSDEVASWCGRVGAAVLRHVGQAAASRLVERVSPDYIASSASLLLLRAHLLRAQGSLDKATESALLARKVAEVDDDDSGRVAAALALARLAFDRGEFLQSRAVLGRVADCRALECDHSASCLGEAYLASVDAYSGDLSAATTRIGRVRELLARIDPGSDEAAFAANCIAGVLADCGGDWASASIVLSEIAFRSDVAPVQRLLVRSNYAASLVELCRISEAMPLLEDVVAECARFGLDSIGVAALCTYSEALHVLGQNTEAASALRRSREMAEATRDRYGLAVVGTSAARSLRAMRLTDESLSLALQSEAILIERGDSARNACINASIEVAASHLSSGDLELARVALRRARSRVPDGAVGQMVRCDLIDAAARAIEGLPPDSSRIIRHRSYLESGSGNLALVFYTRAFPQLASVLSHSIGTDLLPKRVVQYVPDLCAAMSASGAAPSDKSDWFDVVVGRPDLSQGAAATPHNASVGNRAVRDVKQGYEGSHGSCRVRTFGRLDVITPIGPVQEGHWRKRKARLLFLMLVSRGGQEVSRDVIMDYLWPSMDPDHALRNFYVTWSTMKRALARGGAAADAQQYVLSTGGACRITDAVTSDLQDFRELVCRIQANRLSGDCRALMNHASRLADIYAGEFLPSDMYEEWFRPDRARIKNEFCDAMMIAARCAVESSESDTALGFLRRASLVDPWREDVYQMIMRCQMNTGQRGGAIETYQVCRARLVDDLGIDPCAETTQLLQAVLAMEG